MLNEGHQKLTTLTYPAMFWRVQAAMEHSHKQPDWSEEQQYSLFLDRNVGLDSIRCDDSGLGGDWWGLKWFLVVEVADGADFRLVHPHELDRDKVWKQFNYF